MIDFNQYDKQNPQIYAAFKKYAFEAVQKGLRHYSANSIFELIRWHSSTRAEGTFKINNTFRPDYARKLMQEHPEPFRGFFRVRELKAKRK
ncbi:MAG: hypothetical protein WBO55_20100 [Rhizobiaceae bacterium]